MSRGGEVIPAHFKLPSDCIPIRLADEDFDFPIPFRCALENTRPVPRSGRSTPRRRPAVLHSSRTSTEAIRPSHAQPADHLLCPGNNFEQYRTQLLRIAGALEGRLSIPVVRAQQELILEVQAATGGWA